MDAMVPATGAAMTAPRLLERLYGGECGT